MLENNKETTIFGEKIFSSCEQILSIFCNGFPSCSILIILRIPNTKNLVKIKYNINNICSHHLHWIEIPRGKYMSPCEIRRYCVLLAHYAVYHSHTYRYITEQKIWPLNHRKKYTVKGSFHERQPFLQASPILVYSSNFDEQQLIRQIISCSNTQLIDNLISVKLFEKLKKY